MNLRLWLGGIISATSGGIATAIAIVIVAPDKFNLQEGWKRLLFVACVTVVVAISNFLVKSPLPDK